MILPSLEVVNITWKALSLEPWEEITSSAKKVENNAGRGEVYQKAEGEIKEVANNKRFEVLPSLLMKRVAVRALTQLWLDDPEVLKKLISPRLLEIIVEAQQPRLGRVPLLNILQLYFQEFDNLDRLPSSSDGSLRESIEKTLIDQASKIKIVEEELTVDNLLEVINRQSDWILTVDGPSQLVKYSVNNSISLQATFSRFGLLGVDGGRYSDICRAHYYLEKLKYVNENEWSPIFDELLHQDVSRAPYRNEGKRIGHAALEILIDRVVEASETWQDFMLSLAGDPRVSSSVKSYREWWAPLGEMRVEKVRGWLSKQDLRLFLQALEQYGETTNNTELKRMFPARRTFLEGLFRLKMIKSTRLMLGGKAEHSVKRILKDELKVNYIKLDGQLSDKAIIYLDCGDFHLIEGSHSFKLWVYLAPPSRRYVGYEVSALSHSDLTFRLPQEFRKEYPSLNHAAIVHSPSTWQNKVFEFLANNGIELDIEALLRKEDYRRYISRFGMPVVKFVPSVKMPSLAEKLNAANKNKYLDELVKRNHFEGVSSSLAIKILIYLYMYPNSKARDASKYLGLPLTDINHTLHWDLQGYCQQSANFKWVVTEDGESILRNSGVLDDEE